MESSQTNAPSDAGRGEDRCSRNGKHCRHRGLGLLFALVIALVAGAAGGYIGKSFAHERGAYFSADPARTEARIDRAIGRFASRLDATPVQQEQLAAIARGAAREVAPAREKLRDARKQALALAAAPSIDRAGIERLRAEQMQLADSVSRRLAQALADAAEVLTPEQRRKLTARIGERMERGARFAGWHRD